MRRHKQDVSYPMRNELDASIARMCVCVSVCRNESATHTHTHTCSDDDGSNGSHSNLMAA